MGIMNRGIEFLERTFKQLFINALLMFLTSTSVLLGHQSGHFPIDEILFGFNTGFSLRRSKTALCCSDAEIAHEDRMSGSEYQILVVIDRETIGGYFSLVITTLSVVEGVSECGISERDRCRGERSSFSEYLVEGKEFKDLSYVKNDRIWRAGVHQFILRVGYSNEPRVSNVFRHEGRTGLRMCSGKGKHESVDM
jgi:hypothetical protein